MMLMKVYFLMRGLVIPVPLRKEQLMKDANCKIKGLSTIVSIVRSIYVAFGLDNVPHEC